MEKPHSGCPPPEIPHFAHSVPVMPRGHEQTVKTVVLSAEVAERNPVMESSRGERPRGLGEDTPSSFSASSDPCQCLPDPQGGVGEGCFLASPALGQLTHLPAKDPSAPESARIPRERGDLHWQAEDSCCSRHWPTAGIN